MAARALSAGGAALLCLSLQGCGGKGKPPAPAPAPPGDVPKVVVEYFGEAGCPYCQNFTKGNLKKLLETDGISNILDLNIVHFGNAVFNTSDSVCGAIDPTGYPWSGPWKGYNPDKRKCFEQKCGADAQNPPDDCFQSKTPPMAYCQHGQLECLVNAIGACAKHVAEADWTRYGPVVACLEDFYDLLEAKPDDKATREAVSACTPHWNKTDVDSLTACYSDPMQAGEQLQAAAKETPVHESTPYVRVKNKDGKWEELEFGEVADDFLLLKKVCDAWKYNGGAANTQACAAHKETSEPLLVM